MPALKTPAVAAPALAKMREVEVMLAEVFIYAHQVLIAKYAIEQGEYIVGRDATCHIIAEADQVARHHDHTRAAL